MKGVYALVCLALAQGISAHIFRKNVQAAVMTNPLNYYDQLKRNARHESGSSSYEQSKEWKEIPHDQAHYHTHHVLKTNSQYDANSARYGDVVSWKNIQIAVGPKDGPNAAHSPIETKEDIEKIFKDAQQTMKHATAEEKAKFNEAIQAASAEQNEDAQLNATELLQKYNYPVEKHTIKTDDGYILTLFRIPPNALTRDVQKRPVAFLMHDLLGSADDWLLMGPGKSLAYQLYDAGFDVWIGNARGNKYSRQHVSKPSPLKDFWQFSNDEIALHDMPAMINYTLATAKVDKLQYVGQGQGIALLLALLADKPAYNEKIGQMHALAPMVYMTNTRSPLLKVMAPTSPSYASMHDQVGHGEYRPSQEMIKTVGGDLCENEIGNKNVCSNVNFVMAGANIEKLQPETVPVITKHLPAGTSTRALKHYGQAVASHDFKKYDYGYENNKQVYGTYEPPKYDLNNVQAPVSVYYSEGDWLAHPKDVERLINELPNVKDVYKVPDNSTGHMDFQFSKDSEVVNQKVIESMLSNTNN